jgi:glycosyltransferase involved in cell wall biosynthesis
MEVQKSDIIFCMLDPTNINNRYGPPNKLFEAMVAGRPVITTKGTYSGKLTEEENVGIAIEFTKDAFKKAILTLRDDPRIREEYGRNALNAALRKFNWEFEERKLHKGYEEIIIDLPSYEYV